MFDEDGRISDRVRFQDLSKRQQITIQEATLGILMAHVVMHLKTPLFEFLQDKEFARDSDVSSMSHPTQLSSQGRTLPTIEEIKAMIPALPIGAFPDWMQGTLGSRPDSEKRIKITEKARELARLVVE